MKNELVISHVGPVEAVIVDGVRYVKAITIDEAAQSQLVRDRNMLAEALIASDVRFAPDSHLGDACRRAGAIGSSHSRLAERDDRIRQSAVHHGTFSNWPLIDFGGDRMHEPPTKSERPSLAKRVHMSDAALRNTADVLPDWNGKHVAGFVRVLVDALKEADREAAAAGYPVNAHGKLLEQLDKRDVPGCK